jgi:hypothetical protein
LERSKTSFGPEDENTAEKGFLKRILFKKEEGREFRKIGI